MGRLHTHAAVISTGDELVLGQSLDTNSCWLADRLTGLGIRCVEHVTLPDDLDATVETIIRLRRRVQLIVTTGGLGPTPDDLMRGALARVLGEELIVDQDALAALERVLKARGRTMNELLRLQALRPRSAACLENGFGTAPGLHALVRTDAAHGGTDIYCLPGPPGELRPMFERSIVPNLRPDPARAVRTAFVQTVGIAESEAARRLGRLMERGRDPLVGITASGPVLTVRVRAVGTAGDGIRRTDADLEQTVETIRAALAPYVFADEDVSLERALLARLGALGRTLSVVESCTGGLLGELVTAVPGSSKVFLGGWITYSDDLKRRLVGVPGGLIAEHGAVSEQVVRAMAAVGLERSGADHCLAITGIAGPDGGRPEKPVGTVFIAHAWAPSGGGAEARRFQIPGDRDDVRLRSARSALAMAYFAAAGGVGGCRPGEPALLWEAGR